jgi:diguanylate cyclase (GGDEF)-like protein/PAS domain S-box-containing protein
MAVLQTSLWSNMVFLIDGIIVSLAIESMHRYRRRHAQELAQSREAHAALLASTTELKQSEAMLEQFKFTLDRTQDGVFMFRPDTLRFIYVNHGAKRQVGYGTDELLQMTPLDIKPNCSELQFRALLQPLLDGSSKQSSFESVHRHKDGHDIPVEIVLQLVERVDLEPRFVAFARDISERKRNESELHIAAAAFESQEGIMVTDANSVILRINKAFTTSTGYSAAEVVGQTPRIVKSGRHDAAFYAAMWESIKHTGSWEGEIWNRHKDGAIHPKYMTITAVKSDAGAVTHYVGAETDITARKCAETALHDSEAWFRSIFENASTGIASTDSSGRVTSFNEAFRTMLGYDAETLSEMNFAEFTHPDDIALEIEFFNEILEQKRDSYQVEKRYITSDGHIIWIDSSVAVIRGENGEVKNFVGVVTDITDRMKAEEELSLAASVFANTAEGVVITDADSIILSVNPAFEEITGYTANEVLGQKPSLLRSDRHGPAFYRDMWAALLNEGNWKGEIWNRRKNGEAYLEWLTINRIADSTGATVRFVSVFHDITELRRKDEHIRHQAFHDALTGLPNRALFQERLHHALERSKRDGNRLSVAFIDLDGFKNVNDTLGHDVGDVLLQGVANRIRARLRRGIDTVARLGGDEFVLLMEYLQETDLCASLAGEIIADISRPFELGSHKVRVGASMGMAFYPEDGDSVQELMKCADTAMYAAKTAGKGTYRFFSEEGKDRKSNGLSGVWLMPRVAVNSPSGQRYVSRFAEKP